MHIFSFLTGVQCIPQRAALLKSMLNFLKKAIQDPAFSDGIRHGIKLTRFNDAIVVKYFNLPKVMFTAFALFIVMDGSLPTSLKHIISNAEYYGPSLFLLGKYMENRTSSAVEILAELFMHNFQGLLCIQE